jgi:hypothetical protein
MASPNGDTDFSIAEFARTIEVARQERATRDRTFELGGETFTHKAGVEMETLADYYDMTTLREDVSNKEAISIIDATVLAFLEPGQEEKWHKVRHDPLHPITHSDAHSLIEGLLRSLSGRPTSPPSDSTDGPEETSTNSTEDSASKEPASKE